jgi:hypothetical protein
MAGCTQTQNMNLNTAGGILMASSAQTSIHVLAGTIGPSRIAKPAALLAIALTVIALLLLASLHLLSPEFAPSWRMISEYALGHYGWVLSLMFLSMGLSLMGIRSRRLAASAGWCGEGWLMVPDCRWPWRGDGFGF